MKIIVLLSIAACLLSCSRTPNGVTDVPQKVLSSHHWERRTGQQDNVPYDEQYDWVDDATGRRDDCQIEHDISNPYILWVRGAGYGSYTTLEQAQNACYRFRKP